MDYKKTALEILENIGGKNNLKEGMHCFTRLRLYVSDDQVVKLDQLKRINGVVDARFQNGQLQIIIGNEVGKVFKELEPYLEGGGNADVQNGSVLDRFFTTIANIFTPILPAIVGAGLMKGILPLLTTVGWLSDQGDTYAILTIVADTSFNFLPVLIAISASKRFKVNTYLAVVLACSLIYPTILNGEGTFHFFGFIPIPAMSYTGSVIPIILGVWMMHYIYRMVDHVIPDVINMIFTPLIVLAISIPLTLAVFGPLGLYIGNLLAEASLWISAKVPFLYGAIIGGLYPFIIMTGMHYAFFPIMMENVAKLGYENGFLPISLVANVAMAGATLAVALKVRQKSLKEVSYSSAFSALLGITEPALYGVILKYKKPLYGVMIGSGIVSTIIMILQVKMFSFVSPGILSLAVFANPNGDNRNLLIATVAVIVSGVLAFGVTLFQKIEVEEAVPSIETKQQLSKVSNERLSMIHAPISGDIFPLSKCSDAIFAEQTMGKGILIVPQDGLIKAPFSGEITAIAPEKHAIGLTSSSGVELLIHVGIDTVNLKGEGFEVLVKAGEKVDEGAILMKVNLEKIRKQGFSVEVPIVVTNTTSFFEVVPIETKGKVQIGDDLLTVIR